MIFGNYIINKFGMRRSHWFYEEDGFSVNISMLEKFKYFFTCRKQYQLEGKWHCLGSPADFFWFILYIAVVFWSELSGFVLKTHLSMQSNSWVLLFRVLLLLLLFVNVGDYFTWIV